MATTNEQDHTANNVKSLLKENNLQRMRDRVAKLRSDIVDQLDSQLNDLLDDFVQDVEGSSEECTEKNLNKHAEARKKGELLDKEFIPRRSVLTDLLEINHIRTIYHMFIAILIVFSLNTIVYDIIDQGSLRLDFRLITWAFGKFPVVISLWCCMILSTVLIVYPSFQFWAHNRRSGRISWLDYVWLSVFVAYQLGFLVYPMRVLITNGLPPASSVIIVCEQIRLLMKTHAFVRENAGKVLSFKKEESSSNGDPCPHFSKYLYFLFAPTLVYRDNYPRTLGPVRWGYVVSNFGQVLACLFYIYYIFERFCVPVFRHFDEEHLTPRKFILSVFGCMLPGTLMLFIGFFAVLHSWLNAFAEMLRFGDRLFYKDWWNSSSFANYYRTWNIVVHDWLYSYVYKDVCLLSRNRALGMGSVFFLSAVFHEYILTISFGFFFPILFLMFGGAGFAFIFLPKKNQRSGNVFMWVMLIIGNGLLMCLYSMEWYARQRCPLSYDSILDLLIPRSWTCDFIAMAAGLKNINVNFNL